MRALSVVASVSLAVGLLAFDVVDLPVAQAVPVPAQTDSVDLAGVDADAVREEGRESRPDEGPAQGPAPDARPELLTAELTTEDFSVLGVTWDPDSVEADAAVVSVRVREDAGWSDWEVLDANDEAPDPGTDEAARAADIVATEPLVVDDADAVQVRIDTSTGEVPDDVKAVVIDPGTSRADDTAARGGTALSTAGAVTGAPSIITRAQWGADERRSSCSNSTMSTIKAAVVHHTAGTNNYGPGDSASLIRGIYAYHTGTLGWCDVGYNFLVDRYGQVFEGRGGGTDRAVRGAHAGGFNESTFGISALGDFNTASAPDVMVEAIAGVVAWKLQGHYRDPLGSTTLTSAGGGTSKFASGQTVTLPVIMGHRDVGSTACAGANLYARLGWIRDRTAQLMDAALVSPAVTALSQPSGGTFGVSAGATADLTWRLEVLDTCTAAVVARQNGTAGRGRPIEASWDTRRTGGAPAGPGDYRLSLTATSPSGVTALARTWPVVVTGTPGGPPAGAAPAQQSGSFVPLAPARLVDTRSSGDPLVAGDTRSVPVAGRGGVPTSGVTAVALNITSTCVSSTVASFVTVWPSGSARPGTSSLNTSHTDTTAVLVVSGVGADGAVSVYNDTGTTQLVVDVVGYFTSAAGGSAYQRLTPRRVFDSRLIGGVLGGDASRVIDLTGQPGTGGATMTGAVLNVTVAGARGPGYVTVYPAGSPRPLTSTVNLVPGADVANRAYVGLNSNAFTVSVGGGPAHVVVDLVGYYTSTPATAGAFSPTGPSRLLDTRPESGGGGPLTAGQEISVAVAGVAGVPTGARAVVLTLTGDAATAVTYLTAWPDGEPRPGTSDLNLRPGRTRANTVVANVGTDGRIRLFNDSGSTHAIVDVVGYYG